MSSGRPQKIQGRGISSPGKPSTHPTAISTAKIESALKATYRKNLGKEHLMKELESRLSEDLSNFRAIDSLLKDVYSGLERNSKRAVRALRHQIPEMQTELDSSMETLTQLADTLPVIQAEVSDVEKVYDSGRQKAEILVSDLTWLNTEFYERWRAIIFTPSSPVSWRWKVYMRTIFVVSFIICSWLFWIALKGAYRAHRHRLVWGEKLMS